MYDLHVYELFVLFFFCSVIPSLLEYFSYNFCFMTILAGPTATYKEHDDFITGRNMIGSGKHVRLF